MPETAAGKILAIAVRTAENGPMKEVARAVAIADGGLEGDIAVSAERGVTFIAAGQWKQVVAELGADLPWHTRRANILVEGNGLGDLIGKTLKIGDVRVEVKAETRPCGLMDKLHDGLRKALVPDCRGGVYGRVAAGGEVKVGDCLIVSDGSTPCD